MTCKRCLFILTQQLKINHRKLVLQDMLKYTPTEHPDFGNLKLALDEIKTLADRMNKGEVEADQAERDVERLRDIEATIEGMVDLVNSNRKFLRQDLVAELKGAVAKKDRCLFLFSDLLVCTTVRRKTHALRRGSLGLFTGQSAAELNRYKFLWKLPLDDVDISKGKDWEHSAVLLDLWLQGLYVCKCFAEYYVCFLTRLHVFCS